MEISTVTKTIEVTISNATTLDIFVNAVYGDAKNAIDRQRTFYKAFSSLIGISDVEAVRIANGLTRKKENRITTEEFRKWLPTVFAEFARAMLEANDEPQ